MKRYSHIEEVASIPLDEPIFILRARDAFAPDAITRWQLECIEQGTLRELVSETKRDSACQRLQEICDWQRNNPDKVKVPD